VTLRGLFGVSKKDVMLCRWTQCGGGHRSRVETGGYNNFLGDKIGDYNSFFIVLISNHTCGTHTLQKMEHKIKIY
jgi:hypothetical protein